MQGTLTPIVEEVAAVEPLDGPRALAARPRALAAGPRALAAGPRASAAGPRALQAAPGRAWRLDWLLLAIAAVFFALHYVHLRADFPNHSQWMDWAKYTDEGWYGDAAIRHYQLGHWNVPGDFNPAAALPVWPALELILFRFTGVSLIAARALSVTIFGLTLLACYRLLRMWGGTGQRFRLAPAVTVLLLATSSFCFVFTRLAILEPLLVLLTVAALIAATRAGREALNGDGQGRQSWLRTLVPGRWSAVLGALLVLCVLTKTTAVFLFPAIGWMLWAASGQRIGRFARAAGVAGVTAGLLWGGYYGLFVRPHFREDYKYLFSANQPTGFQWNTVGQLLLSALNDALWIGSPLCVLAVLATVWALARALRRGPGSAPLPVALVLWVLGYLVFLTYHANLAPRYYLVVAVPLTALVALALDWLWERLSGAVDRDGILEQNGSAASEFTGGRRAGLAGVAAMAVATAGVGLVATGTGYQTVHFVLHPEYTWLSAAEQVATIVNREAQTGHPRLIVSISGSEMSLMTGVRSICDYFGTMHLEDRVATYRPGWFVTWNQVDDSSMEGLAPYYRLERVAAIPAFDDPDRNLLIVYRLDPLSSGGAVTRTRRRRPVWVPRSLRTPVPDEERRESAVERDVRP